MHLAWRWFAGLGFDEEVPHHSTFSKNRHERFHEATVFEQLFEEVVARCLAVGLVRGDKLSVDGTFVAAVCQEGSDQLELLSAGHGPILVYSSEDKSLSILEAQALPLGILP